MPLPDSRDLIFAKPEHTTGLQDMPDALSLNVAHVPWYVVLSSHSAFNDVDADAR
jgi:hypothetical protein